jgi:hypothetical protein
MPTLMYECAPMLHPLSTAGITSTTTDEEFAMIRLKRMSVTAGS